MIQEVDKAEDELKWSEQYCPGVNLFPGEVHLWS